jgi:uncharacterized protein (TIGR03435 family)
VSKIAVFAAFVALASAMAQAPEPAPKQFQIVSIKKNLSGPPRVQVNPFVISPDGRFIGTNVTLADVIVRAYRTRRIGIRGGPEWMDSERFNILAKADDTKGELKREEMTAMVQELLKNRFKLALHVEKEERTVYALVAGQNPSKLQPAKAGEQTSLSRGPHGEINFQNMPMAGLAEALESILHAPVVDGTGITGSFDFTLDPMSIASNAGGLRAASPEIYAQLVVAAVQQQLGFKFEKQRMLTEVTVIDHAEEPTDN